MTVIMAASLPTSYTVTLSDMGDHYKVIYGSQVRTFMDFESALNDFNHCVMHSAECAGLIESHIDNLEDDL